jgi:hypothetical protein
LIAILTLILSYQAHKLLEGAKEEFIAQICKERTEYEESLKKRQEELQLKVRFKRASLERRLEVQGEATCHSRRTELKPLN